MAMFLFLYLVNITLITGDVANSYESGEGRPSPDSSPFHNAERVCGRERFEHQQAVISTPSVIGITEQGANPILTYT